MTANFTYSWKPVNNTNFAVCIVVASNELDTKVKPLAIKLVSELSFERKLALVIAVFVHSKSVTGFYFTSARSTRLTPTFVELRRLT